MDKETNEETNEETNKEVDKLLRKAEKDLFDVLKKMNRSIVKDIEKETRKSNMIMFGCILSFIITSIIIRIFM